MEEFLGYEDLLIGSVKYLSASEGLKGYVVNVMSGQHYKLVISQMSRSSYFAAALIMLLFVSFLLTVFTPVSDILYVLSNFRDESSCGIWELVTSWATINCLHCFSILIFVTTLVI